MQEGTASRTELYDVETSHAGRQVRLCIRARYTVNYAPWWGTYGHGATVVGSLEQAICRLANVERIARGHITRHSLHLYVHLGVDDAEMATCIKQVAEGFFGSPNQS